MANVVNTLGRLNITSGGTLQRVSATSVPCHAVCFQVDPANANFFYVFNTASGVAATRVGCVAILAIPTDNSIPSYSPGISPSPNTLNLNEFWIDGTTDEGVIVTYLVA
jgi:hypothetical protein